MRVFLRPVLLSCLWLFAVAGLRAQEHWVFLDNGHVRLGVNMDAGGSIGWFSHSHSSENLLNAFDHGRYVQQSYYGDKDGSDWNGKPWRYNPVQGGSWKGVPATVLETRADKDALYVRTRPRQWAGGGDVEDMVLEQTLSLEGGLARLRYRMRFTGGMEHKATHQEVPAVFVMPRYDTLVYCEGAGGGGKASGAVAWSGGELTRRQPGFPNEPVRFGEPWAAWVDANDQGIGIYFPHTDFATTYRVRNSGVGDCSYLAPIKTFALRPGLVFEYEAVMAIGTSGQIRAVFSRLHQRASAGVQAP
jgi:hypothetical protein